jgi:carbonic anhydrase
MTPRCLRFALLLIVSASLSTFAQNKSTPEFGYSGADGPKAWGDLSPAYSTCKLGHMQSPIDIRGAHKEALPAIQFDYKDTALKIINNGHSIQVNYAPGSWITVGDKKYELRQFHFHHPSEEHIDGRAYDMVVHLVHADADGQLVVVAILLKNGSANGAIQTIWDHLPDKEGQEQDVAGVSINAAALLPQNTGYYEFQGSLTTPPCTEGVTWYVLKTPVDVSRGEVDAFAKLYPHNARPIQSAAGRRILESQ